MSRGHVIRSIERGRVDYFLNLNFNNLAKGVRLCLVKRQFITGEMRV